jgi:hypothetical protein
MAELDWPTARFEQHRQALAAAEQPTIFDVPANWYSCLLIDAIAGTAGSKRAALRAHKLMSPERESPANKKFCCSFAQPRCVPGPTYACRTQSLFADKPRKEEQ